jgi:alpha-1,3-rhamnosyl/mannosyltransferase
MMNDLMPEVIARASHIVADSEFTRGEVIGHYGARPARVSAVPLGVADHFRPVPHERCAAILAKRGLEPGRYLLALGTIEPRKNLATTIAAYAGMPPALRARFPLVVSGMEGWGGALLSPAMREPIARGEVRLTGYVPQDELPALYSGARAFVYPSLYEGFGLPPLEAMACGAPVIVSSSSSLPEVVGDAGLLVEALDAAALGHAMQSLVDDGALRERLAAQGIARAARFTWRACAERTMQAYRSALDASP